MKKEINLEIELNQVIGSKFSLSSKKDRKGLITYWCNLDNASDIKKVAIILNRIGGRLITVTASKLKDDSKEIVYHFDLHGACCNIILNIDDNKVDSITPILKTADWTERELKELYDIEIIGHPNPKRLFLDETIAEGVMNNYIPLSEAMNGSSSQTLWEKVITATSEEN